MFKCERCGSRYSAVHASMEDCPRCKLRDRVSAPLAFGLFELSHDAEQQSKVPLASMATQSSEDAAATGSQPAQAS